MEPKDKKYVLAIIDNEGFDYAFHSYSDFDRVKDDEFHRLRQEYLDAHKK